MTQQNEKDLQRLLRLPWTVIRDVTPEGDVLLRVREIPSAVGSGESDEECVADLWESLAESLRALIHFGDPVPLPDGVNALWTRMSQPAPEHQAEFFFVGLQNTSSGAAAV